MEPYKKLYSYAMAKVIDDLTITFGERYLSGQSRLAQEMIEASGAARRYIREGAAQRSLEGYIRLLNIAQGSVSDVIHAYADFLRQRHLAPLPYSDERVKLYRSFRADWLPSDNPNTPTLPSTPEEAANMVLTFCEMEKYLLNRQIAALRDRLAMIATKGRVETVEQAELVQA